MNYVFNSHCFTWFRCINIVLKIKCLKQSRRNLMWLYTKITMRFQSKEFSLIYVIRQSKMVQNVCRFKWKSEFSTCVPMKSVFWLRRLRTPLSLLNIGFYVREFRESKAIFSKTNGCARIFIGTSDTIVERRQTPVSPCLSSYDNTSLCGW